MIADPPKTTPSPPAEIDPNAEDMGSRLAARRRAWRDRYVIVTEEEAFVFEQLVVQSVRLEDCQRRRRVLEAYESARAAACWDEDRRREAEELGATLRRRPPVVSARLASTKSGCDWLLDRWARLARPLQAGRDWTEAQRALAFDLLGTPHDDRDGPLDETPESIVAREQARLRRLKADALDELDDFERAAAISGRPIRTSRAWDRLKREEDDAQLRHDRARSRLRAAEPPALIPAPPARVQAPIKSEPEPEPEPEDELLDRMTDEDWLAYEKSILMEWLRGQPTTPGEPLAPVGTLIADRLDALTIRGRQERR